MNGARWHGFTLLEVLLALALTALILVALGMAVDFHFRVLDKGRAHVEEAQLARVLLRRIADDLRGTVPCSPQALQQAAQALTSAADTLGSAGGAGGTGGSGSTAGGTGGSGSAAGGTDSSAGASALSGQADSVSLTTPHTAPGIYGDAFSIQIDVSRLPQPYQLQAQSSTTAESLNLTTLGDVKTVSYFANGSQSAGLVNLPALSSNQQGLVRCEADRAVASYQAEHGGVASANLNAALLAPEVAGLAFVYSDGTQWLESWDTTQNGGLPVAVRVTIYITAAKSKQNRSQWSGGRAADSSLPENTLAYSLLVHIPCAEAMQVSSDTSMEGETGEKSDSSKSASGSGGDSKSSGSSTDSSSKGGSGGPGGRTGAGGTAGGGTGGGGPKR